MMQNAIILNRKDVKKILAEHFHVDEKKVICSQYSFTVTLDDDTEEKTDGDQS